MQLAEGIEGMIHVSDITAEKRINHPADVLRVGQIVKAQVLAIDPEKRQMRLGMKQLVPTGIDEYIAEHNEGDVVTGRLMDESGPVRVNSAKAFTHVQDCRGTLPAHRPKLRRNASRSLIPEFHAAGALEDRLRAPTPKPSPFALGKFAASAS